MAEEHINTAFGALGALDVILRRCMEGFTFWQRINDSSDSAKKFQILLDMQRVKLAVWAQEWGIESNNHRKDRRFCMYEAAVMSYLRVIHHIFSDFGSLDTPVPVLNQTRAFVSMDVLPRVNLFGASSGPYGLGSPGPPTGSVPTFSMQGIKWALQEDKLTDGLALLTTLLNDLYTILPPPRIDPAGAIVLSDSLTAQDPNELARISRVENNDPIHAALAWMKSVAYRPYGAHLGNNQLYTSHLVPINRKEGDAKFMARYQDELVFVEEKYCTVALGQLEQLRILKARIDNIVVRLQDPDKPVDLRTLPCRGGAFSKAKSTAEDGTTWTYNIVYRADYPRFISLRKVLGRRKKTAENVGPKNARLPLGKRFVVAQMLARALMYLHLADWLHKAVRSENVIFFVDDEGSVQSNLPYLIGFEYSRPDVLGEQTENVDEKPDHKYYRHPKALAVPIADLKQPLGGPGRYSKVYDIYSMGVVLLEIGLFATADRIVREHLESNDQAPEEIRKVLVEKAIPDLRFAMGDVYADAALACLDGSLDKFANQSLHQAFYKNVVRQLDVCNA
ncbi:Fc.00g024880.m01.CDS01 [Cosmosporella sp. VM-42]